YLKVKAVDLNGDGRPEFIIEGDDGPKECLRGNRNFPTWLYRRTASGYELLLKAGNELKPLATSTNGYRDLENSGGLGAFESLTIVFKFDGNKYRDCTIKHYAWQGNKWVLQSTENKCAGQLSRVNGRQRVASTSADNWENFWNTFRAAVQRRDRRALRAMMIPDFSWTFGSYPPGDHRDTFF